MKALGITLATAAAIALVIVAGLGPAAPNAASAGKAAAPPGSGQALAAPATPRAPAAPATPQAPPRPGQPVDDPKAVYRVPLEGSPTRGPDGALLTVVAFSDLECQFCEGAAALERQLEARHGGRIRFVWKHRPMSFHRSAVPAAIMAEAARAKGGDAAFFAAVDAIFRLEKLEPQAIDRVAREAGLDPEAIRANPSTHIASIRRDQNLATDLGVMTTPTWFVNGRKVTGLRPLEALAPLLDEELARAEALLKTGVAPAALYARLVEGGATAPVRLAAPAAPAPAPAAAAAIPVRPDDAVRGPASAPVTVVLFSDFQCPYCARVEPTLRRVEEAFPGKVRIAWRHQPLSFHPNALPAAKAAEAARLQGRFWQLHDRLFAGQAKLSDAAYLEAAKALGLDVARFEADRAADATARRIAEDQRLAAAVGATGTPTLFINCRKVTGARPFEELEGIVREELRQAEAATAGAGGAKLPVYDRRCAANVAAAPLAAAPGPRTDVKVALRPDDPVRGPASAKVTVVEFSDFQCPFCARAVTAVKEVEQAFGPEVRFVWKHLPLAFHPQARPAALAAEAARAQGKFWEMHDRLFEGQQALSEAAAERYAAELRLDLARFRADRAAPETRARVEEDLAAAGAAGVTGTPTFVVNGEVVVGAGGLKEAVQRHLARAMTAAR